MGLYIGFGGEAVWQQKLHKTPKVEWGLSQANTKFQSNIWPYKPKLDSHLSLLLLPCLSRRLQYTGLGATLDLHAIILCIDFIN